MGVVFLEWPKQPVFEERVQKRGFIGVYVESPLATCDAHSHFSWKREWWKCTEVIFLEWQKQPLLERKEPKKGGLW